MDGDPRTSKYRGEAAPKDVPYRTLICGTYARWYVKNSGTITARLRKETGKGCSVCLKTMEEIDKNKDQQHNWQTYKQSTT